MVMDASKKLLVKRVMLLLVACRLQIDLHHCNFNCCMCHRMVTLFKPCFFAWCHKEECHSLTAWGIEDNVRTREKLVLTVTNMIYGDVG